MAILSKIWDAASTAWHAIVEWVAARRNPQRMLNWSEKDGYIASAEAFSAISGVKIVSENEAMKLIKSGKQVTPLEIKDVFYGQLDTSAESLDDDSRNKPLYYIPDSAYDPDFDYDFADYKEDDTECTRGDYPYRRPAGWARKAVNVLDKYEDDVWLGKYGWRNESSPGEWPVSYHGTNMYNVPSILSEGYDLGKGEHNVHGVGIYSTPDFEEAKWYAAEFEYKGKYYKCILQNRVNLQKTKVVKTKTDDIYFVTPDANDIRPYGVCLKKVERLP